jgi:integrase
MRHTYTLFRRKGQKIWYFYYYYAEGKRSSRSTGESLKYEAERYAAGFVRKISGQSTERIRLLEFASGFFDQAGGWVRSQKARNRTFGSHQSTVRTGHLKNYVLPKFGSRFVDDIASGEIDSWLLNLPVANGTKNAIISTLNIVFKEADRRKLIRDNPMRSIERMASNYKKKDTFSLEELGRLFPRGEGAMLKIWKYPKWATMFYLMLTTGLRRGEAAALQWQHVVWDMSGILILQAVKAGGGGVGDPKNNDKRAAILPERSLQLLKWWKNITSFPDSEHFVFFGVRGDKHLYLDTISRRFPGGLEKAGISTEGRNLSVHSLRHTYNTRMERLLPGEILRYMIGHKSESMTAHYTHITPKERLKQYLPVKQQLDEVWN